MKNYPIDVNDKNLPTNELIEFVKSHIKANKNKLNLGDERNTSEIIILTYFEFLYSKFLDKKYDRARENN